LSKVGPRKNITKIVARGTDERTGRVAVIIVSGIRRQRHKTEKPIPGEKCFLDKFAYNVSLVGFIRYRQPQVLYIY